MVRCGLLVKNLSRSHDAPVTFAGFLNQSQIVRAYVCWRCLVLPSIGETWGMVVNEAMACGRPALVSDRVGCGSRLVMGHDTGAIFPHGNVAALSSAMINMASNRIADCRDGAQCAESIGEVLCAGGG